MRSVGLSDVNMSYQSVWLLCTGQSYPFPSWVIVPSVLVASSASSPSECLSRSCACRCLEAASRSSGMWWDLSVMYSHNIRINLIEYFFQLSSKYWIECLILVIHTWKIRVWFLMHVPFILMNFFFPQLYVCLFVCSFCPCHLSWWIPPSPIMCLFVPSFHHHFNSHSEDTGSVLGACAIYPDEFLPPPNCVFVCLFLPFIKVDTLNLHSEDTGLVLGACAIYPD